MLLTLVSEASLDEVVVLCYSQFVLWNAEGNIRPHVISLLFRSLVSTPLNAVTIAHETLREVLNQNASSTTGPDGAQRIQHRIPRELLQTCIRPVLLNLRDYTRLSVPLLRGLSRLLSLLSSWFTTSLGEKLLDHLQKWTEPSKIVSLHLWDVGEEPNVASAIIDLFALLPQASQFVEPLVKTTIKLENALPGFRQHHVYSPYRKPLARYLSKHSKYAVAFFFQRLKTPIYSELFQDLVRLDESSVLRTHLSGKQCSVTLLNICFERPLAIIRSEKASSSGGSVQPQISSMTTREILAIHGIRPDSSALRQKEALLRQDLDLKQKSWQILHQEATRTKDVLNAKISNPSSGSSELDEAQKQHKRAQAALERGEKELADSKQRYAAEMARASSQHSPRDVTGPGASPRPMSTDALELQYQGFLLVESLVAADPNYLQDHNDVVRAFRWFWRSKGRHLRLQHEETMPPRYHSESKMLASFLARAYRSDVDVLFELIRIFFHPASADFSFVKRFLAETVSTVLTDDQKRLVVKRFFALMDGDQGSEETKLLSIQLIVFPMLQASLIMHEGSPQPSVAAGDDTGSLTNEGEGISHAKAGDAEDIRSPHVEESDAAHGVEASNTGAKLFGDGDTLHFKDKDAEEKDFKLLDLVSVDKFVNEVLFKEKSTGEYGDRLKVEMLRILNLLLEKSPATLERHRKNIMKFAWSLLKCEDYACKSWAYVVVSRFISVFDTPSKIILQVYGALLRSHQQEGRRLVRMALSLLVPSLPLRLLGEDFQGVVDQTNKVIFEEGNSVPQLAHIWQTIAADPEVFYPFRHHYVRHMINSLNRLGLPPNCPQENRTLAVAIVELVLEWNERQHNPDVGKRDSLAHEGGNNKRRISREDEMPSKRVKDVVGAALMSNTGSDESLVVLDRSMVRSHSGLKTLKRLFFLIFVLLARWTLSQIS